jgi:hypothetical protein
MVADEILNYIIERTKKGKGEDGEKFPGYSNAYKKSFDFKVAGKSSLVNLTLSGEMLDTLEVLEARKGKIVIGFPKDSDMNGRAEGNILGTYGSDTPDKKKARNFLGLSNDELGKILKKVDVLPREDQIAISKAAKSGAYNMVDSFKFNVEGEDDT